MRPLRLNVFLNNMRLYIKNMVCHRCVLAVEQELKKQGITARVDLGEVETTDDIPKEKLEQFGRAISALGFELLDNSKNQLIEKIKNVIIQHVHHSGEDRKHKFSEMLSKALQKDYSYLSGLFSEVEGITIEKYIINQKIEKVKELLVYDQLSLSEIAYELGYSSVAHLSGQFKKVTGMTPSQFKKMGENRRRPIDQV